MTPTINPQIHAQKVFRESRHCRAQTTSLLMLVLVFATCIVGVVGVSGIGA